ERMRRMRTLDEEIKAGWDILETLDAPELEKAGSVGMKFIVENDAERCIVFVPEPEAINDPDAKTGIAQKVQELVREHYAHTVFHIWDTSTATLVDPKAKPNVLAYIQQVGVVRAAELGLIERREALMCQILTRRGECAQLIWYYKRGPKNEIT